MPVTLAAILAGCATLFVAMKTLTIDYPDDLEPILDPATKDFATEARALLAYKLFEIGRLTSGQAARFAGIPRALFLLQSRNYGVASVSWDQDELKAEALPLP